MKNKLVFYIVLFVALITSQILIFNQLELGYGVHIMIYPMFILLLPFDIRPVTLMVIAFFTGITIDWFTNSFGLHTSSAVLLAYLRPRLFSILEPRDGYDSLKTPLIRDMGRSWFMTIYLIGLVIHHFWFFLIEVFKLYEILFILQKTILSSIFSFLTILLIQVVFFSKQKEL